MLGDLGVQVGDVGLGLVDPDHHLACADPDARFEDLGADHYDRRVSTTAKKRSPSEASKPSATTSPRTRALTAQHPAYPAPLALRRELPCLVTVILD